MKTDADFALTRRDFLAAALIIPESLVYAVGNVPGAIAASSGSQPTPACTDRDDLTPPQTAGPFFKAQSPERKSLLDSGMKGTRLVLEGQVLATKCRPVQGALVDFWQADSAGVYDNTGYRLRGHQFSDASGRYRLETIVPGVYPGRTRHIHVRVQAPNRPVLTTQLYFPGEPENQRDGIFNPRLVMALREAPDTKAAKFDFVLNLG